MASSRLLMNFLNLVSEFTGSSALITKLTILERPTQKQTIHRLLFFKAFKLLLFIFFYFLSSTTIALS